MLDEADEDVSAVQAMIDRCGRVVVKPNWGNRGIAVATDVRDMRTFARARERAQAADLDEEVVVEPYVAGTNLRVAVIGGQALAAAEVQRPRLVAGASALEQVAALNRDPRRGSWQTPGTCSMDQIEPEEDLGGHLEVYGLDLEAAIPSGREVEITGDEAEVIDRTDEVDRGWLAIAERACGLLGVDVGGVDLRGPLAAFRRAPQAGSAVLLEVNVLPALHLHALPTVGAARPVFEAFVAYCLQLPGAPRARAQIEI
jgi:cyanophycin synthetase